MHAYHLRFIAFTIYLHIYSLLCIKLFFLLNYLNFENLTDYLFHYMPRLFATDIMREPKDLISIVN